MIDKELKTLQQERYMTDSSQFKFSVAYYHFLKYIAQKEIYMSELMEKYGITCWFYSSILFAFL